jgi:hypothetical protein
MKRRIVPFLLGGAALGLLRLAFAPLNPVTHYHANWRIEIQGAPLDLSADRYMEEVAACTGAGDRILPSQRVHLHENNGEVVHVHHDGATWGQLLANLGMSMGEDFLFLDTGERYLARPGAGRLTFILNGIAVPAVHNRVIQSEDRLLISFGDTPAGQLLEASFPQVAFNAGEYNEMMDPASCAGGHGDLPLLERLRLAFWG